MQIRAATPTGALESDGEVLPGLISGSAWLDASYVAALRVIDCCLASTLPSHVRILKQLFTRSNSPGSRLAPTRGPGQLPRADPASHHVPAEVCQRREPPAGQRRAPERTLPAHHAGKAVGSPTIRRTPEGERMREGRALLPQTRLQGARSNGIRQPLARSRQKPALPGDTPPRREPAVAGPPGLQRPPSIPAQAAAGTLPWGRVPRLFTGCWLGKARLVGQSERTAAARGLTSSRREHKRPKVRHLLKKLMPKENNTTCLWEKANVQLIA
jgi:hypothetical protein